MSLDIYAAVLNGNTYEPVMDFKHAEMAVLCDEARGDLTFEGNPFVMNPDYVPGVCMTMSGGSFHELIEKKVGISIGEFKDMPMNEQRIAVGTALEQGGDSYTILRLVELHNILGMGIARGAEKLIWV